MRFFLSTSQGSRRERDFFLNISEFETRARYFLSKSRGRARKNESKSHEISRGAAVDHKALLHEEGRGGRSTDGKYSLDLFWVNYIVSNQESIILIFRTNSVKWEREKEEGGLIPVSFSPGIFAKYIEFG